MDILDLARRHGATVYTNRALPGEPAVAFGNESWPAFCAAFAAAIRAEAMEEAGKLPEVLAFDSFLNEPPEYEDMRRVREFSHAAYPRWLKVIAAIRTLSQQAPASLEAVQTDQQEAQG